MHVKKKWILETIAIQSFVTALPQKPQKRVLGGISQADCPFSNQQDCTVQEYCSDGNYCHNSDCCGFPVY